MSGKSLLLLFLLVNSIYTEQISRCANGLATYFSASDRGNCGLGLILKSVNIAAAPTDLYKGSMACGVCYEVFGEKGTITVMITDKCPTCEKTSSKGRIHLDIDKRVFPKIDEKKKGKVPVSLRMVPCNVSGNIKLVIHETNNYYWNAYVINSKIGIKGMELQFDNGSWKKTDRSTANRFILKKIKKFKKLSVKIIGFSGEEILCYQNQSKIKKGTYDCGKQFRVDKFFDIFSLSETNKKDMKSECCKKPSLLSNLNDCKV
jgi:expansin (peptidoglycan-binding protein)